MTDIARERRFLAAQGLRIASRETWGAIQSYTSDRTVFEPVEGFVLHISVTIDHGNLPGSEHPDMRTIERIGQERFGIGFPYNAAVFDTGRLYEGQPLTRRGAHTVDTKNIGYRSTGTSRSMNFWWRAIVLPQMVTDDVTDVQVDQCARWAAAQIRAGYAKRDAIWIGHRDVAWKSCPGDAGYARLPRIRQLTEHYVRNGLAQEDDMTPQELAQALDRGGAANKALHLAIADALQYSLRVPRDGDDVRIVGAFRDELSALLVGALSGSLAPAIADRLADLLHVDVDPAVVAEAVKAALRQGTG